MNFMRDFIFMERVRSSSFTFRSWKKSSQTTNNNIIFCLLSFETKSFISFRTYSSLSLCIFAQNAEEPNVNTFLLLLPLVSFINPKDYLGAILNSPKGLDSSPYFTFCMILLHFFLKQLKDLWYIPWEWFNTTY